MQEYAVLMSLYIKENPEFFVESFESILNQTVQPSQIIVVKDGPLTLDLEEKLKRYSERYPELLTVIEIEENVGLGLALNRGLSSSKYEIVARMDTDDISFPNRMEIQLDKFDKKPNLAILGANILEFKNSIKDAKYCRNVPSEYEKIIKYSKKRSPFNHPTIVFRKSVIEKLGGYPDTRRKEDLDLFLNLLASGFYAENLPEPLLYFRANNQSFIRRKSKHNCESYIQVMKKYKKRGYIGTLDYVYVWITQKSIMLLPIWVQKLIYKLFIRSKESNRRQT